MLHFLSFLSFSVGALPFFVPEDRLAASEAWARRKLSQLSESARRHAGTVWAAGTAAVAALAVFIGHHLPIFIRAGASQIPAVQQHPQEAMSGLLSILLVPAAI